VSESVVNLWKMPTLVVEAVSSYRDYNNALATGAQTAQVTVGASFFTYMWTPEKLDKETLFVLPVLAILNHLSR
jgi:hypothetical protein